MRQMLPIIPGRIPPPAMRVDGSLLPAFEFQMPICLVVGTRTALIFEVVNEIRHGGALEQIALDEKRKRTHAFRAAIALEVIPAFSRNRIEIECPEIPVTPLLHRTGSLR